MSAIQWLKANEKPALHVLVAVLAVAAMCFVWVRLHPAQVATFESQHLASLPAGVEQAANNAQVPLTASQATRVVQSSVQASAKEAPVASVVTTGAKVKEAIKTELQKFGQFAIVTDPAHPAVAPVVPPAATVTLNQYNIKAYPDRLIQVGGSYQEVFAAYSWRVLVPKIPLLAPHGTVGYLGVYTHINFDQPANSRAGVLMTIPR